MTMVSHRLRFITKSSPLPTWTGAMPNNPILMICRSFSWTTRAFGTLPPSRQAASAQRHHHYHHHHHLLPLQLRLAGSRRSPQQQPQQQEILSLTWSPFGIPSVPAALPRIPSSSLLARSSQRRFASTSSTPPPPPSSGEGGMNARWTAKARFPSPKLSPVLQKATDLFFYRTEVLLGVAVGGAVATAGAIGYYMYERGQVEKLLSKTDRIKLERAEHESGFSLPIPLLTFVGWACLGIFTAAVARTKANLDLNFRQFGSRVNYSLNGVVNGHLKFRTVQEKSLDTVLLGNSAAISLVRQAVKKVTETDPFLRFPPADNFFMMTAILNDLSPISALSFFQADRNMEVERVKYVLGLTFEKNAPFKKLRVQIVSEELLERIAHNLDQTLDFEDPLHHERWQTLRLMATIYSTLGTNNPQSCLWRMEMAIPRAGQPHPR